MSSNTSINGDPRSFFYYRGDYYINKTEIILKDDYINKHQWLGRKLWKYAKYDHQVQYNGRTAYFFCATNFDRASFNSMGIDIKTKGDYAAYFLIEALDLESAIEKITRPIKLERNETEAILEAIVEPKSASDNPALTMLWIVYLAVMVGSLIFRQFYIIWIVASFLFFKYRKEMLN